MRWSPRRQQHPPAPTTQTRQAARSLRSEPASAVTVNVRGKATKWRLPEPAARYRRGSAYCDHTRSARAADVLSAFINRTAELTLSSIATRPGRRPHRCHSSSVTVCHRLSPSAQPFCVRNGCKCLRLHWFVGLAPRAQPLHATRPRLWLRCRTVPGYGPVRATPLRRGGCLHLDRFLSARALQKRTGQGQSDGRRAVRGPSLSKHPKERG